MLQKKRLISFTFLILFLIFMIGGCASTVPDDNSEENLTSSTTTYPYTLTDARGKEVTIEKMPEKIVSLAPSVTEILFALGLEEQIVGVTNNCNYPPEASSKEKVGDFSINIEKVISLEPDLVIGMQSMNASQMEEMDNLGLTTLAIEPQSIEDIKNTLELLGKVTSTEEEARGAIDEMNAVLAEVEEALAGLEEEDKKSVFMEIGYDPLFTVGKGSLQDEIIHLAGGVNAVEANEPWLQYSLEKLVVNDPDFIVFLTHPLVKSIEDVKNRPGWQEISALKEGNILIPSTIDPYVRPVPRTVEAIKELAQVLYPERF